MVLIQTFRFLLCRVREAGVPCIALRNGEAARFEPLTAKQFCALNLVSRLNAVQFFAVARSSQLLLCLRSPFYASIFATGGLKLSLALVLFFSRSMVSASTSSFAECFVSDSIERTYPTP